MGGPAPIAVQLVGDPNGLQGPLQRYKGKEIYKTDYRFNPVAYASRGETREAAEELWNKFLADYRYALQAGVRTIIWDKEDYVWELFRHACFGDKTAMQLNFYELNCEYRLLVGEAIDAGVSLGLIRGLEDQWVSREAADGKMKGHNTGVRKQRGMKEIPEIVDVNLHHRWDDETKSFYVEIGKCRPNGLMRGEEFKNPTFTEIACMVFGESNPENWE